MLSRVANSIYWINRYIERAENYARFIDVNFNLALEMPNQQDDVQWRPILEATTDDELFAELCDVDYSPESVLNFMIFEEKNPNSILSCINAARENARTIRENMSIELWEHLNAFYLRVQEAKKHKAQIVRSPREFLKEIKSGSELLTGIEEATITHNEGWHFGRLGRFMERADKTARFIDVKYFIILPDSKAVGSMVDMLQWSTVLKSTSAYMMYRRKYGQITPQKIVEFLILDRMFPRSIYYCLHHALQSLKRIATLQKTSQANPAAKKLAIHRADLFYTNIDEIINNGLHEYIDSLQLVVNEVNNAVYKTFFEFKD
jgi:uncharacterized alpha-E superfamily protein